MIEHELRSAIQRISRLEEQMDLVPMESGGSGAPSTAIGQIVDGIQFFTGSERGVGYLDGSLQDDGVTDEWTTDDYPTEIGTQDYERGIGAALITESGEYVLVINDADTTEIPMDIPSGTLVVIRTSEAVTLTVIDSDPEVVITAYPIRIY